MDLESVAKQLMMKATETYDKYGFICPLTMFASGNSLSLLPVEFIELFRRDKERYARMVRDLVAEHNPDAVVVVYESCDVKDGKRMVCAFLLIDTIQKQAVYISEISNMKLVEWRVFGVYDKLNHTAVNVEMAGMFTDFYGNQDIPKIDG